MRKNDYIRQGLFNIFDEFVPVFRAIAVAILFLVLLKTSLIKIYPFSVGNAFIYCYFIYAAMLLIFKEVRKKLAGRFPLLLPLIDLTLLTMGIAYSGGEASPYYIFYTFYIVFMALTYGLKYSLVLTAMCILFYVAAILIVNGNISSVTGLKIFYFLAFSLFAGILEGKIHRHTFSMAIRDSLTSLYNYEYFYGSLDHILKESARLSRSVSLAVIDVDDFKCFNDKHGHLEGDRILSVIASIIKPLVRNDDVAARYGGDELVIIFPNTGKFAALKICERIKDNIVRGLNDVSDDKVTISIGISAYPDNGQTPAALFDSADKALYKAKQAGKNNIVLG